MIKARFGNDFDRVVHRILPFVARIRLQPNTLTLIGVGVSALAAAAFAVDRLLLAGSLVCVAGFFDLIDGVVARAQGKVSRAGAFFDSSMDRLSDLLIFSGIAVFAARSGDMLWLAVVLWALSASVMTSYVRARAEVVLPQLSVGFMERAERLVLIILGGWSGLLQPAVWLVAIGATITSIQRVIVAHREISRLPEPQPEATAESPPRLEEAG